MLYYNFELDLVGISYPGKMLVKIEESNMFVPMTHRWIYIGRV